MTSGFPAQTTEEQRVRTGALAFFPRLKRPGAKTLFRNEHADVFLS
jgi:hypothetical protein